MSIEQIQGAVVQLPEAEKRKLAAWMLAQFPLRSVHDLVSQAEAEARQGQWSPQPPGPDNFPTGPALEAALRRTRAAGAIK